MSAIGNSWFWWVIFLNLLRWNFRPNEPKLGRQHVYKVPYKGSKVTVIHYISLKQSICLFSLFTDGGNFYSQLDLVQCWQCLFVMSSADSIVYYRGQWHYMHMTFALRRVDVWLIKLIISTLWYLMLTQLNVIICILHTWKTFLDGINSLKGNDWYYKPINSTIAAEP